MVVSIVTATYNSASFIKETYASILSQTFTDWEWVVTDDCSDDNTYEILKEISLNDSRIRVFKNSVNAGAAVSRNRCLDNIRGDYVAFLDSDDLWFPDKLMSQINFMREHDIKFSFTSYIVIDEYGNDLNKVVDDQPLIKVDYNQMLKKTATLGCSTVILQSSLINGVHMPLLRTGQDYAYWLRILKRGECAYLFRNPLTKYRITSGSISRNKFKKCFRQWYIYRRIENISLFLSMVYFVHYAFRAVFRK